jgi:hypothetical protein
MGGPMKNTLIFTLFSLISSQAHATGMVRIVHNCSGGTGEYHSSVEVKYFSMSAPRGPIRSWYEARVTSAWLGGNRDSGYQKVDLIRAADGGPINFINKRTGFYLTINSQSGRSASGNSAKINASAKFVDQGSRVKSQITNRDLSCR